MKTLYININNEQIQSNDEFEVFKYDLDSDFFFHLGEKISKGCKVQSENSLITNFNTPENEADYKKIISQWNELKDILFSDSCEGTFEFSLPKGYIRWLKFNANDEYKSIYDANFTCNPQGTISIDLEELYEDTIEILQRNILRALLKNNLYLEIDKIVFNDNSVTRKSPIVRAIKDKYEDIRFIDFKKSPKPQTTPTSLLPAIRYKPVIEIKAKAQIEAL